LHFKIYNNAKSIIFTSLITIVYLRFGFKPLIYCVHTSEPNNVLHFFQNCNTYIFFSVFRTNLENQEINSSNYLLNWSTITPYFKKLKSSNLNLNKNNLIFKCILCSKKKKQISTSKSSNTNLRIHIKVCICICNY